MEVTDLLGTRLVLENGTLEMFSRGVSVTLLGAGGSSAISRIPRRDGLALTIRYPGGGKLLAFDGEQVAQVLRLLAEFEASSRAAERA